MEQNDKEPPDMFLVIICIFLVMLIVFFIFLWKDYITSTEIERLKYQRQQCDRMLIEINIEIEKLDKTINQLEKEKTHVQ